MFNCCNNCFETLPDITVYMNCDTRLAVNLRLLELEDNDELIFTIKNYNYIDSSYVFLFRARNSDMDEHGEVIFKIPPAASKRLKPGAFYNFAVLLDAFDPQKETEYKKMTGNGNIRIEYGAQDLTINPDADPDFSDNRFNGTIAGLRLELLDEISSVEPDYSKCEVKGVRLELLDEVSSVPPAITEILGMRIESLEECVND